MTREVFNQGVRIHNAEQRAAGHLSQVMELVLPQAAPCDEFGNRKSQQYDIHIIMSDNSSLSPPPTTVMTTDYRGSDISFPKQTQPSGQRVSTPCPTTSYGGSILAMSPSALPMNPFSTPRANTGIIAQRYIQSEENTSQHVEKEGGMEETRKVYTPIPRKFEISDDSEVSDEVMTEVEWRDEEPYMTPTKKGKKRNKGKGVKRPETPE